MKVTVTFGDTAVVVPCKAAWTVRDLTDQATRRYRRILEQHEESEVKTHHLTYIDGGIMDMDDLLDDLVEDRDKLVAVFDVRPGRTESPRETMSNGYSSAAPSPEPLHYFSHLQHQQPIRAEIEVNEAILKANTPLLVRSSSDSALTPSLETRATPSPGDRGNGSPDPEINHVLKGALDRLHTDDPPAKMSKANYSTLTKAVEFPTDWGPLGIHVIPYCSSLSGRTLGLHIKGIEENSRSAKENIFQEDQCIVQINDTPLQDKTFAQSQEVFRQAMTSSSSSSVRLEVLPPANKPRYEKSLIGQLFTADGKESAPKARSPMAPRAKTEPEPRQDAGGRLEVRRPDGRAKTPETPAANAPLPELQPGHGSLDRVSATPPARGASSSPTPRTQSQSPLAGRSPVPGLTNLAGRKGGKTMKIDLKKGGEGLGFTVVTRDSTVHGPGPILVKNILPRGAAVKDGRLQPGDRILEVNGVDMEGRSQEELVAMLRSTRQGESVCVVVARQEDIFLPRELVREFKQHTQSPRLSSSLRPQPAEALGPTLGLWKSSSLESLQTAVSEAKQSRSKAQVPFHRPRPHMVRGRGSNQSFRIAIDKSYDGPSEDDDDLTDHSSGFETPASSSSRQGLDVDDGNKKKKTKGKKKEKKSKGKKKTDDSVDDAEKKTKKKGFGLLRFGKKKDDKSKDAAKASKSKLEVLGEEELDRNQDQRDSYDPRYAEIHSGYATPDASFPDVEDDDSDPNYARINNFRQPPSPRPPISRTPSPAALTGGPNPLRASSEELDGLYAKVNKSRPPLALQNQHQTQADSDPRLQGLRREYQQARAAPGYDELDAQRRRVLEHDPHRMAPRGADSRPAPRYEDEDRQYPTHPRRDPYDYPTHSRPVAREAAYPGQYHDPPQSHQAPSNQRYHPSSSGAGQQHRAAVRQDVPPSPTAGRRGRNYYEAAGGRGDQASPGRYTSPERYPDAGERHGSPERYELGDERRPDPRRKNPLIGAV
ncbi:LOW QUALITY PROTEIN: partitioning defective 3 homolog B-like [Cebidichthys violaceus]|uniref:LOW QUALITY PROTEIN: partitioning defective 3 homolog B-like n=1 Tax=Cebidichthys violaceus TaxID=271503 RepID=UPI0035CA6CB5